MNTKAVVSVFIGAAFLFVPGTDAESIGEILNLVGSNIVNAGKNIYKEVVEPPQNKNSSLRYPLYTQKDPKKPCFLEPTPEALQECVLDPNILTVFLIPGFLTQLNPGNLFEVMKDTILESNSCNVIIVDYSQYDNFPVTLAVANSRVVGRRLAEMIEYLKNNAGIKPENIYLIGHSLGAGIAGLAGRQTPNLGKITGLDPATRSAVIKAPPNYPTDANFVEILHSSDIIHGAGIFVPVGDIDFYPNGGKTQPFCKNGARYRFQSGQDFTVEPLGLLESARVCYHEMAIHYFIQSINSTDCTFRGTMCDSYSDFLAGKCPPDSSPTAVMGFYSQKVPGVPPRSKFYFRTRDEFLFCLKDGYEP